MTKVLVNDPTLRDGNHAVKHKITLEQISAYVRLADEAKIDIIEVGHGNGIGASSLQLGLATHSDEEMLKCARNNIIHGKLGVHAIPGFAKLNDLQQAIEIGVDIFRIASHCTEANTTQKYIEYIRLHNRIAHGVLMMSHMADLDTLVSQAKLLVNYGAQAIIIMDSAGAFTMKEVNERITALVNGVDVAVGFHGHNNLNLAVANTIVAAQSGATLIDATSNGLGAGAGNTCLEALIAVLEKSKIQANVSLNKVLDLAELTEEFFSKYLPKCKPTTIIGGLYGVCSAFEKHILKAATDYHVDPKCIYKELANKKVVAGQEDLIIEIALKLANKLSGTIQHVEEQG